MGRWPHTEKPGTSSADNTDANGGVMNRTQKAILICAVIAVIVTLLYPPFHFYYPQDHESENRYPPIASMGYAFIFDPPSFYRRSHHHEGSITVSVVLLEWLGIGLVAGVLLLVTKK
jgi:H+/Cl- antiporter ClcA